MALDKQQDPLVLVLSIL